MSSSLTIYKVNTKLVAYRLVHDPTRLLSLLFSKYGYIEEDYYTLYTNLVFYNIPSHFNIMYKENKFMNNRKELLKRFYKIKQSIERLPKLSDYYKNYLIFFCRPFFKHFLLGKIINAFKDKQAEIFYKNNYVDSANDLEEKEYSFKKSSDSLSSLDNITNNKIIFDERTKKLIDNNLNSEKCTLTLTLESSRNNMINRNAKYIFNNGGLISKRSNGNSSFEKDIYSLVNYKLNKKKENINKKIESRKSPIQRKKKFVNSPSSHPPYISQIFKKNNNVNNKNKEIFQKDKKIKNSLYILAQKNYKNNCLISNKNDKDFLSPKTTKHNFNFNNDINLKFEEFYTNKPIIYNNNYIQSSEKKNKIYSNTNNINTNKIISPKNNTTKLINGINTNTNTIFKNFSLLSETLNRGKVSNKNKNITFTNKNKSKILKTKKNMNSTNILIKSNNNENNNKTKKKKNKKPTYNKNIINTNIKKKYNLNINKHQTYHIKNNTFDFNTINQNEQLNKYNTNNNFEFKSSLSNTNGQKNVKRKKINSKFNLITKPINEVIILNPLLSPQVKKSHNKITNDKSISQKKEKNKKNFYGLNGMNNININNNYNSQLKFGIHPPKKSFSNRKINNKTFNLDDNNKKENNNINIDSIIKKNKNKSKNNKLIKYKNKLESIKSKINYNNNWKFKTPCLSPFSNYRTNLKRFIKNFDYNSFNISLKMDNSASQNNNEIIKSPKNLKTSNINTNLEVKINTNSNNNMNNNKYTNDLFNMTNINQNENSTFSRNKNHNTSSKIINTHSQKEIKIKDIHIKSIKNLKSNCIGNKSHISNISCSNDSNSIKSKYNNYYNCNFHLNKSNSSTGIKNNHIKDALFNLNKITIKKKNKKHSQRNSKIKEKNNFDIKPKKFKNNKEMLDGDDIFNKKNIIEIKQNSLFINNKGNQKYNIINNFNSNNTISDEIGNSFQIIIVNRNINLLNKNENKNGKIEKLSKI